MRTRQLLSVRIGKSRRVPVAGLVSTSAVGTVIEPLAQNVLARVVMEILGHSQLAMTTDLYSHVMPTAPRAAADAMDRALVRPN
jgi:hypothetical protein